jgi:hypothetical protein
LLDKFVSSALFLRTRFGCISFENSRGYYHIESSLSSLL